jgi:hypothetical protein
MQTLKQFFRKIAVRQLLIVCLAGILMLATTACGNTRSAASPPRPNPSTTGQGMYPHEDTTRDTSAVDAKARKAVEQADRRRQKVQTGDDYFEKVQPGQRLKNKAGEVETSAERAADEVGDSAQQAAKNASKNTQRGLKNLKENAQNAVERASDAVDQAT